MPLITITIIIIEILSGAEVDIFTPSFPDIQRIFALSPFTVELMLGLNFCAYTVSTFIIGNLGDKYGTKPVIIWGLIGFALGSFICAFAQSYNFVLLGRILQGIGIAGPSALAYVVIANQYSVDKQQNLMGWLNGIITLAMATAPIIGSYINLFFGWRGNFILLAAFSILVLVMSFINIPSFKHQEDTKNFEIGYMPIFRSESAIYYIISLCLLTIPYWIFIGISPILYMDSFNMPIDIFGYYQGAIAFVFAIVSFASSPAMSILGKKKCFYGSIIICLIATLIILIISLSGTKDPNIITASFGLLSIGVIFPINILWPCALEIIPNAKSRISAISLAAKLIVSSFCLQFVSYYYDGTFFNLGMLIVFIIISALFSIRILIKRSYLIL